MYLYAAVTCVCVGIQDNNIISRCTEGAFAQQGDSHLPDFLNLYHHSKSIDRYIQYCQVFVILVLHLRSCDIHTCIIIISTD